jgi:hypothetical protein
MKKFMFTAIAMMAFSVGSMATTIEVTDLVTLDDLTTSIQEQKSNFPCSDNYRHNVVALTQLGFNEDTARVIARAIFDDCINELYG